MRLPDYAAARRYLEQFVPGPGQFTPPDLALARTVALMHALDDPQEARPVIHLAGTSGKGSTATLLAAVLAAHGQDVSLVAGRRQGQDHRGAHRNTVGSDQLVDQDVGGARRR